MNTKPHGRKKQNELGTQKNNGRTRRNVSGVQKKLEGKILVECKRGWSRPPAPKPGGDPNRALGCRPGSVPCTGGLSHGCWPPWGRNHTPPLPHTAPMAPHPTHKKIKEKFFSQKYMHRVDIQCVIPTPITYYHQTRGTAQTAGTQPLDYRYKPQRTANIGTIWNTTAQTSIP